MSLEDVIVRQLANCRIGEHEYLKASGWMESVTEAELDELYKEYILFARQTCVDIAKIHGAPTHRFESGFFAPWFPEAIYGSAWEMDRKVLFVAVEHHDKESPVGVIVGALSFEQVEKLSA